MAEGQGAREMRLRISLPVEYAEYLRELARREEFAGRVAVRRLPHDLPGTRPGERGYSLYYENEAAWNEAHSRVADVTGRPAAIEANIVEAGPDSPDIGAA